jgi:CMP-N,N'-diacetyllegionaminic acid synthase
VVRHAIAAARAADAAPDAVMLLQATSPMRLPGTLSRAVAQLEATGVDSLVGVVAQAPFIWAEGPPDAGPTAAYDVTARPRRQDLTPATLRYRETGSVYLTRTWVYDELDNRIGGRVGLFVMDELEGIDVDTELDLEVADRRLSQLSGSPA